MHIKNLEIHNFRNYSNFKIDFDPHINIIYGDNGQGKTNLLESIYVLALTKSHRAYIESNLIKDGEKEAVLKGTILMDMPYNLYLHLGKSTKHLKIDDNPVKTISSYIAKTNVIIFSSEDLDLIKGGPAGRRKYLDLEISQLSANYYTVENDLTKLLKIRNDYLKKMNNGEPADMSYFDILTDYIVNKSVFIYQMRKTYIDKVNKVLPKIFKEISGLTGFNLKYNPSIDFENFSSEYLKETLKQKFKDNLDKEIILKNTLYGPQRDDFTFCLEDNNLREFGSQGQQKMGVIALKLSEIEVFKDYKKQNPIILLDDVFSDLDNTKKNNLLKHLDGDMQIIITTTDLKNIDKRLLEKAKLIHIKSGQIIENEVA